MGGKLHSSYFYTCFLNEPQSREVATIQSVAIILRLHPHHQKGHQIPARP